MGNTTGCKLHCSPSPNKYHSGKSSHLVVIGIVRDRDARLALHGARHHEAPRGSHPYNYCREQSEIWRGSAEESKGTNSRLYTLFLLLEGEAKRGNRTWQTWDAAHSLSVSCLTPNIYSGRSVTTDVAEAEPPRTCCPAAHS